MRPRLTFRQHLQWVRAIWVAAAYSWRDPGAFLRRLWALLKVIFRVSPGESIASPDVAARRLEVCRRCPIFYAPLETCGSPKAQYPDLGCWCYSPAAVQFAAKGCWGDENDPEFGSMGWEAAGVGPTK